MTRFFGITFLAAVLASSASVVLPVEAQMRTGRGGMMGQRPADPSAFDKPGMSFDGVERRDSIISATGLEAVFPARIECQPICLRVAHPL